MDPIQKRKEYYSAHPEMIGMNLMGKGANFARGIPGDEGARRAGVPTFNEYMAAQDAEAAGQVVPLAPASPPTQGAPVPMPRPVAGQPPLQTLPDMNPRPMPMPRPIPQTGGGLKREPPNFQTGGELVQGKAPRRSNDLFRQYMALFAAQGR